MTDPNDTLDLRLTGAFPGRVDPFAENAHDFHAIHAQLIGVLLAWLQEPLMARGYVVGRETSLQIAEGR